MENGIKLEKIVILLTVDVFHDWIMIFKLLEWNQQDSDRILSESCVTNM